jgi:hypothetical protein
VERSGARKAALQQRAHERHDDAAPRLVGDEVIEDRKGKAIQADEQGARHHEISVR